MSTKDQNLINIVCKASIETGAYGLIIVRPSYEKELSIDLYEGFTYDKGMISSYLGTNGKIVLEEPYVILVNDNIKTINEFENIIYEVKKTKKDLLVIANSFSKEVVDYIIYLKKNYKYNICATLSPEFGERAGEMLEDLAIYLNTYVITNKNQYLTDKTIGVAERIEITNNETIIRRNDNKNETRKNNLEERISYLMNLPNKQEYHYKRIACLKGKIAYINVPIDNEYQYELLVQKIKNGISACKNSMISGVIEGSAKTLKDISLIKTGKEIIDDILEGLSILSHLIDQNNYYEKNMDNDNSILDSAYNTEIMISNVFELVRLFVSIDGIIINKSLNTTEKTIDDIFI